MKARPLTLPETQVEIKDVWASTLDAEMAVIRELVERYPYVAMDTEFPGVVAKPVGDLSSNGFAYQTLQCNVDLLKIIQLGISFCGENGETPAEGCYCYQFNFRFDLNEDMYAEDSIELLKQSGIDFDRHAAEGIDVYLTWGLTAARTTMGLADLPKEAKAVGGSMRASLVSLARKGSLGDEWQPHPAVCEIGEPSVALADAR